MSHSSLFASFVECKFVNENFLLNGIITLALTPCKQKRKLEMLYDGSDMQRIVFTCNNLVCFACVAWEKVNICASFDVRRHLSSGLSLCILHRS